MSHTHNHHHHHAPAYNRVFALGVGLNLAFVAAELLAGTMAQSLALLADAGHNFSDVIGLLLAWGASWLAQRRPTARHTYGWRRASILAALGNAMLLLVALGGVTWEALQRLGRPQPVDSMVVVVVAAVGIAVNALTAVLFLSGSKKDLNIRGAFLHMAADAGVSLGVVIAGLVTVATGWLWLDSATSLAIVAIIFIGTWGLLRESLDLALDAVPQGIEMRQIDRYLRTLPGVNDVHDLHVWALSTTEPALTAHLVTAPTTGPDALLHQVTHDLHERFGIEHTTIQVEHRTCDAPCNLGHV